MAIGTGTALVCAVKKASTWGTSVAVGASNGFRPTSWSVDESIEPIMDASFNADAVPREAGGQIGLFRVGGTFGLDVKYDGLDLIFALFMGTAGAPTGANPYTHTWYRKNDMTGLFATLVWYDGIKTHEIDSVKFTKLAFKGQMGKRLTCEVSWIGRRRQENTATNANVSSVTENSTINYTLISNSTLSYQLAANADALANVELNEWDVTFEREYEDDGRAFSSSSAPYRREPTAGEFKCSGSITIPHEATTYMTTALHAGSFYKLKLNHTLASPAHEFGLWVPMLKFTKADFNPSDRASIPQKLTFEGAMKGASTPSGFAQAVPYIRAINAASGDALA